MSIFSRLWSVLLWAVFIPGTIIILIFSLLWWGLSLIFWPLALVGVTLFLALIVFNLPSDGLRVGVGSVGALGSAAILIAILTGLAPFYWVGVLLWAATFLVGTVNAGP